jgi:hypothetical protein
MPELQHPDIVGNFLSSYGTAQQNRQAQEAAAFNQQRVMRQDERAEKQFDMEMDVGQLRLAAGRAEALDNILKKVRPGDENSLNQAKTEFVSTFGGDPQAVAGVTMDRVMELRAESDLKLKELRARIAATDRSNRPQPGGGLGGLDNKTFDNISGLRKEFQGATKDFGAVRDAYGRIKATSGAATPAGDISMIYAYMKMLDPTSVVRESEFSIAQNARPLLDRMGLSWDSFKSAWQGQKLQPEVRRDFLNQASSLYKQQLGQYENTKKQYGGLAQRFGFDPALVLTDQTGGLQPDEQAPPPGDAPPPAANGYTVRKVR